MGKGKEEGSQNEFDEGRPIFAFLYLPILYYKGGIE